MPRLAAVLAPLCVLLLATGDARALERSEYEGEEAEAEGLKELLEQEGVDLEVDEDHHDRLREVLRYGFAHTPSIEATLEDLVAQPRLAEEVSAWSERLAREVALARIRPTVAAPRGVSYDIPIAQHALVDTFIDYFTGRGRWFFERWLARADRYIPLMLPILRQRGLPEDTVYLAMIESGFVSKAYSRAAASGFWQFIASTGRMYKLDQTQWVDERRDFVLATHAACDYLNDLYKEFGDWPLAWSGYNAGGGRVRRAINRAGTRDFWRIVDTPQALPIETRQYSPKIIAAAIVAKNREHYGFGNVESLPPLVYDEVPVEDAVALKVLADRLAVPLEDLEALNPALLMGITPPRTRWTLRVPKGRGEETATWLAASERKERMNYRAYQVQPGDTLWKIAERLDTDIAAIREFNGINNPRSLKVGQQLIIPRLVRAHAASGTTGKPLVRRAPPKVAGVAVVTQQPSDRAARARHVVGPGETLWSISQRYNVSVQNLKAWNGRAGNAIGIGEVLQIF